MEQITIARPYAEAAFEFAREHNTLSVWAEMLRFVATVIGDTQMQAAVANPKLNDAQKEALFLSVCGERLDIAGRNFIKVLLAAGRLTLLPEIRTLFEQLKNQTEGVMHAQIFSAQALSEAQQDELVQALAQRYKCRIDSQVTIDPSLIGGVKIVLGDEVIDGSVRGKLAAMSKQLKS